MTSADDPTRSAAEPAPPVPPGPSVGSTGPHPDLDALADLDAGVLDAGSARDLTAHVETCRQCTATRAAFGQVRADLAALPAPALPVDVAERFDQTIAALGAEGPPGPASSGGPAIAEPEADRSVDVLAAARRRRMERAERPGGARRPPRWTGWAAGIVAVLALGAGALAIGRQHNTTTSAASGGAAQRPAAAPDAKRGTQYGGDSSSGGGAAPRNPPETAPAATRTSRRLPPVTPSSAPGSYTRATIGQAVAALERRSRPLPTAGSENSDGLTGPLAIPMRLADCRTAIGDAGTLTGAGQITYEQTPAYLLVFTSGGTHRFYVVGQDCGSGGPSVLLKG